MEDRPVEQAAGAVTAENLRLLGGIEGRTVRGEDGEDGDEASSSKYLRFCAVKTTINYKEYVKTLTKNHQC